MGTQTPTDCNSPESEGAGASPAVLVRPLRITPTSQQQSGLGALPVPARILPDDPVPGVPTRDDLGDNELARVKLWRQHWRRVEGSSIYLQSVSDSRHFCRIRAKDHSRYHAEGRKRLQRRVLNAWGDWPRNYVILTLTYDPARISREDAWANCTSETSRLLDNAWVYRKRHGQGGKPRPYLWVLEEQPGTGYPHIHMLICDTWFAPKKKIAAWWGHGRTQVEKGKSAGADAALYVAKYVGKLKGWTDNALAHIWAHRSRIFGVSQQLATGAKRPKRDPEWLAYAVYTPDRGLGLWAKFKRGEGVAWLGVWRDDWRLFAEPGSWCDGEDISGEWQESAA